ncbi:hypothetical protein AAF712_010387 [Marasmius tenuissimus]|uniref:Uncharacterized protein n=1 Tax=Marasmius tenuissimus TaxID=585030 RepID=A0ABR2ZND4_9AGAR
MSTNDQQNVSKVVTSTSPGAATATDRVVQESQNAAVDPGNDVGLLQPLPALASVANIAANLSPPAVGSVIPVRTLTQPEERDENPNPQGEANGPDDQGNVPPTSPRKPRRTLRKTASTVTVAEKGKDKEKEDHDDEVTEGRPEGNGWPAYRKWVKANIHTLRERVDDMETMHLSLAEAVRVNEEEARSEQQTVYRMLQEAQLSPNNHNNALADLARDPVIISLLNTTRSLQDNLR